MSAFSPIAAQPTGGVGGTAHTSAPSILCDDWSTCETSCSVITFIGEDICIPIVTDLSRVYTGTSIRNDLIMCANVYSDSLCIRHPEIIDDPGINLHLYDPTILMVVTDEHS